MTTFQDKIQIFSQEDLIYQGFSPQKIHQKLETNEIRALRRGIYVYSYQWKQLTCWEQYRTEIQAYGRRSPDSVFSHQTAALLWGLPLLHKPPEKIHVLTKTTSRGRARMIARHLGKEDYVPIQTGEQLWCTDISRTILDCSKSLPLVEGLCIADSALHQKHISHDVLSRYLFSYKGNFSRKVHKIAQLMSMLAESPGESGTRLLLHDMGINFEEQKELFIAGRKYRVDFYLTDFNVVLEFDGEIKYTEFGDSSEVVRKERWREKALTNAGYRVFRTSWNKVFFQPSLFKSELNNFLYLSR